MHPKRSNVPPRFPLAPRLPLFYPGAMKKSLLATVCLLCLVMLSVSCAQMGLRAAHPAEVEWMSIDQASYVLGNYSPSRAAVLRQEWRERWGFESLHAFQEALLNGDLEARGVIPKSQGAPKAIGASTLLAPETLDSPR
jgi:hypothetical protein